MCQAATEGSTNANRNATGRKVSKVLVCGSIALDLLGSYAGSFADYQNRYPIKALNFSLQLEDVRTSFGGCVMNIAYGLTRLGVDCVPLSVAGSNFEERYRDHLTRLGVNLEHIVVDHDYPQCATAILLSDNHGNQITAFHAGSSVSPKRKRAADIDGISDFRLAVLAPEDAPIMLRQARDLNALGVPVLLDPGQGVSGFSREEIRELLELSDYVIANAHEWEILQLNGGVSAADIVATQRQAIVTHAALGVDIHEGNAPPLHVPVVQPRQMVDASGCGDAFRAGYVFGLLRDLPPEICARTGCLTATYNIESDDTQCYDFAMDAFLGRYRDTWGEALP